MMSDSNIDDIGKWLDDKLKSIDFTMPGRDQSLARDLTGIVAQGIIDRTVVDMKDAEGKPLKPNEAKYAAYKARRYGSHQPGVRTGQTLDLTSVLGEVAISADEVTMTYGTGQAPTGTATGAALSDADRAVTDREKAGYLTKGGRAFYAIDGTIADAVIKEAGEAVGEYLAKG